MDTTTNKRTCDICNKTVDRWDISTIKKIQRFPGELYYRCSSDIRSHTTCLTRLCPTCMEKMEKLIYKHINNKGD